MNDADFDRELAKGRSFEERIMWRLRAAGLTVEPGPEPVKRDRYAHSGQLDLIVGAADPVVVEVKSNRHEFTGPADFPFRWCTVDVVDYFASKAAPVAAYVIVSQPWRGVVVVPVSTRPAWRQEWRTHPGYSRPRLCYELPREELRTFGDLTAWLHDRERQLAAA